MDTCITDSANGVVVPACRSCIMEGIVGAFSHCAVMRNAVVSTEQPLIPLSAIILSSQRQMTDTTYGVQCMLHVEDSLSSVTVSSVVSKVEAIDDAIFEVGSCELSTNFWLNALRH
jgi:hypothetical protein